jgi:transposase
VSSKFLTVSFKNEKDQEMVYNVSNLKTGINGFLKKLKTEEYKIVVEATGSYSSKILHYASSLGFDVYQISPLTIKKYAEVKNVISKTDDEDAKLIRFWRKNGDESLQAKKRKS